MLNARRHRSGEFAPRPDRRWRPAAVLNARRHRSGEFQCRRCRLPPLWVVLNARRHRSGEFGASAIELHPCAAWCSTPEGIGAASSRSLARSRAHSRCAQRPKASERRVRERIVRVLQPVDVLNARRHRSGEFLLRRRGEDRLEAVLNARRHRSGEFRRAAPRIPRFESCSTPEGIGAASSGRSRGARARRRTCAQRPKASERRVPVTMSRRVAPSGSGCSTPEGIGAASSDEGIEVWPNRNGVLNARRHRSGEFQIPYANVDSVEVCSTPEGIGAASSRLFKKADASGTLCSTPEGIGAASSRGRKGRGV